MIEVKARHTRLSSSTHHFEPRGRQNIVSHHASICRRCCERSCWTQSRACCSLKPPCLCATERSVSTTPLGMAPAAPATYTAPPPPDSLRIPHTRLPSFSMCEAIHQPEMWGPQSTCLRTRLAGKFSSSPSDCSSRSASSSSSAPSASQPHSSLSLLSPVSPLLAFCGP